MIRPKTYYSRLRKQLTLALFLFLILPLLFYFIATLYKSHKFDLEKTVLNGTHLAEQRFEAISQYLDYQVNLLSTLAGMYSISSMTDQEHLEQLFLAVNKTDNLVDLHVIDSSGKQLSYVGPYRNQIKGKNYLDSEWFKEVLISGRHISDVFTGYRNISHLVVAVTDPLKTYVLRATINSDTFNSFLLRAQQGPRDDAFIINRQQEFQTPSLLGVQKLQPDEQALLEFHEGIATLKIGSFQYTTKWMKDGHWLLVIKSEIISSIWKGNIDPYSFLMMLGIILLLLTSSFFLSNYVVNKMEFHARKQANLDHQMLQVDKMATVGRLAAGIAHEINNPLQMIVNQAGWIRELLLEEDRDQVKNYEEYTEAINKIKYHIRRAGTITHRLLGFSRKMSTEKEFVNVNELIEETVSFVHNEALHKNIIIKQNLEKILPTTMTDGPQLQQVFLNVLNNGLDAIDQNGRVDITTSLDGDMICIEFADSGPGISPEVMEQIFEPFFTTKDPGKGTGLGLYICYDIMQKLGGKIEVSNRPEGGTLFRLTIPVKKLGRASK